MHVSKLQVYAGDELKTKVTNQRPHFEVLFLHSVLFIWDSRHYHHLYVRLSDCLHKMERYQNFLGCPRTNILY